MPFTKDLIIATTVLVGCCLVLFLTLSEPSGREDGTVTVPGGPELAMGGDEPTPPPPDQPPAPPEDDGGSFAENGGSSLDFDVFDQPSEPADEPLVADVRPSTGGSPFNDPGLMSDDPPDRPEPRPQPLDRPEPRPQPLDRPEPGPTPGASRGGTSHTVAKGETLMDVSFKHYGTHHKWREIVAANDDVDPDALVVGTVLTIPELGSVAPASAQGRTRGDDGDYVVKKGDSYYTIARDVLGDSSRFQEIARLNSIDPYDLMPGDVIKLPAGARVPTAGTATPSAAVRRERELPPGGRWHTVEKYEVLGDISAKYYGTATRWRDIAAANGISDPATLKAGQKLIIPGAGGSRSSSSSSTTSRPSPSAASGGTKLYTIQKGDLLESIARNQLGDGTRWREIMQLNPGLNPRKLKVGDRIALPADARSTAPSPSAAPAPAPRQPRERTTPVRNPGISWPELDATPRSGRAEDSGGDTDASPFDRIVP